MVERLRLIKIVDGVRQQQCTGLRHAVVRVAQLFAAKDACDLPAGRIAHQRIILRLHAELLGIRSDELDGPAKVFQRGIVRGVQTDAVAQRKHRIALLVQLPRRGNAAAHLTAVEQCVAGKHHGVLCARLLGREIIQLGPVTAGVLRDLLRAEQLVGDLCPSVVGLDQVVHPGHTAVDRLGADHLFHGVVVLAVPQQVAVTLPDIYISIKARALDAGVFPQLLHRGLRRDLRCAVFCRRDRQRDHQQQADAHRRHAEHLLHFIFSFFSRPVPPRMRQHPSPSPRRRCRGRYRCCAVRGCTQ